MLILLLQVISACRPAEAVVPTNTPRPTLEPRTPPTAIPTSIAAGEIQLGEPVEIELPGGTFVELSLMLDDDTAVMITAKALTDDYAGNVLDVVFDLLDADNNLVIYDDDGGRHFDELADTDAGVKSLDLSAGDYTLRVNAFNGFQQGRIEVLIQALQD